MAVPTWLCPCKRWACVPAPFGVASPHRRLPGALMRCRAHHPLTTRPRAPPCLILLVDGLRFQQEVGVPDHHHHVLELGAEQAAGSGSPCPVPPWGQGLGRTLGAATLALAALRVSSSIQSSSSRRWSRMYLMSSTSCCTYSGAPLMLPGRPGHPPALRGAGGHPGKGPGGRLPWPCWRRRSTPRRRGRPGPCRSACWPG